MREYDVFNSISGSTTTASGMAYDSLFTPILPGSTGTGNVAGGGVLVLNANNVSKKKKKEK